jgi:hypothetical protein
LLVCFKVEYDPGDPQHPYSIRRLVARLAPRAGSSYPLLAPELWVFAQFADGHGSHRLFLELVRIDGPDPADEVSIRTYGPYLLHFRHPLTIQNRGWKLTKVPFRVAGLYEFRLRVDGIPEPLASEPIVLE